MSAARPLRLRGEGLDAIRLHPERMELVRSMERWVQLSDGAIGRHHFEARTERDVVIERMRKHSRFDAAWRAAQNKSIDATARLTVLADWLRLRFTDGTILQTTDEVDLILRHTDLDPAVPAWAFNMAEDSAYIAFGESWASRPAIATLSRQTSIQVEGCYVTSTERRRGLRVLDVSVVGRVAPNGPGSQGGTETIDTLSLQIDQEMQPLLATLGEALAKRRIGRGPYLPPMVMVEVLTHAVKVLLYAAATDHKHVVSLRRRAGNGEIASSTTAFYPKMMVGPASLDSFLPSNMAEAETDTVWHWHSGLLSARPERDSLRIVFTPPALEPRPARAAWRDI